MRSSWNPGPEAGNTPAMNHHPRPRATPSPAPALRPELADLERVVLGPALPETTRHWLLFDGYHMGVLDTTTGSWWPLSLEPDGRFCFVQEPSHLGF